MKATGMLLLTAVVVGAAVLLASGGGAYAQRASSFQNSCTDTHVRGSLLEARCRRIDGSWSRTAIEIPGVENIDGRLQFTGVAHSNYQLTCREIEAFGSTLSAVCRRIDGAWSRSSIQIPMIANINGELRYEP